MLDLAQFGTIAGLAIVTSIILQVLKGSISGALVNLIPVFAMILAIVLSLVYGVTLNQTSLPELAQHALIGFAGGLTSVGGYEAIRGATSPRPPTP